MEPKLIINLYNGQLDYQFISKSPKVHLKRKDIAHRIDALVHPEISEAEKSINNMLKERTKFNKEFLTTRIVHFVQGLRSVVPLLKEALVTFSLADLKYLDQTQLTKGQISFVVIDSRPIPKDATSLAPKPSPEREMPRDSQMDTHAVRHLASVSMKPPLVLDQAMEFFNAPKDRKVVELPRKDYEDFQRHYHIEAQIEITPTMTLEELAQKIAALKSEGMSTIKSFQVILAIIDALLKKEAYQRTESKGHQFLIAYRARILELIQECQELKMFRDIDSLIQDKLKNAKIPEFQEIGVFLQGGWPIHYIHVELLHINGKWRFIVAQAGNGVAQHHRTALLRDQDNQPCAADLENIVPIKMFEVESENEAKALGIKIYQYSYQAQFSAVFKGREHEGFYALFEKARVIDEHNIPFRKPQSMGNCSLRSQEEGFFYLCQRLKLVEVANDFVTTLEEMIKANAYPALLEEMTPKEPIQPLVETLWNLEVFEPAGGGVHYLPFPQNGGYMVGRAAGILLPRRKSFSREQATIVMEEGKAMIKGLVKRHKVEVIKVDGSRHVLLELKKIEIQRGDILKFSGDHELTIGQLLKAKLKRKDAFLNLGDKV